MPAQSMFLEHLLTSLDIFQASLETFFGLGLIAGPMVGGVLYSVGGYFLPFVSLGLLLFIVAGITMCILPQNSENCPPNQHAGIR